MYTIAINQFQARRLLFGIEAYLVDILVQLWSIAKENIRVKQNWVTQRKQKHLR